MNWLDVMFCVNNFSTNIKSTSLSGMLPSTHSNFKFKALLHYDIVLVPSKSVSNHTLLPHSFVPNFSKNLSMLLITLVKGPVLLEHDVCKSESQLAL